MFIVLYLMFVPQDLKLEFDPPLFYNLELIGGVVGGMAEYSVRSEGEEFTHKMRASKTDTGGFEITISKIEGDNQVELTYQLATETTSFNEATGFTIKAGFNSFGVNMKGARFEKSLSSAEKETLTIAGVELETNRQNITYEDGTSGVVWRRDGIGPLGIVKIVMTRKDHDITYTVKSWEP